MRATIVKGPKSKLYGAICRLCGNEARTGQSVLHKHMTNTAYLETRLVYHTVCMKALVARAPEGSPVRADDRADAEVIRSAILTTGDPYARTA